MSDNLIKRSVLLRMVLIGGLTVALLIPSVFIMGLVDEREGTRDKAVREVSDKWGNAQTVAGPILTVPYRVPSYTTKEGIVYSTELAHFLPESLIVSATLQPEIRYRGMYEAVLYSSRVLLEGSFAAPAFPRLGIAPEDILWNKASLSLGISDLHGVKEGIRVQFGDQSLIADPGVNSTDALSMGISVQPALNPSTREYRFSTALEVNGSGQFLFVPVGKETNVHMSSAWSNPSFVGSTLPIRRTVHNEEFTADWKVLHLNRNYPQQWSGKQYDVAQSASVSSSSSQSTSTRKQ